MELNYGTLNSLYNVTQKILFYHAARIVCSLSLSKKNQ